MSPTRCAWCAALLLALLLATQAGTLRLGFHADDYGFLEPLETGAGRVGYVLTPGSVNPGFWRPITQLGFVADHAVFGLSAWGYRLSNVLVAALALAAAHGVLLTAGVPRVPALIAALLAAVHPATGFAVTWISGRSDLLALLFVALALLGCARWVRAGGAGPFAGFGAAALAAVLSKETALLLPVYLLAVAPGRGASGAQRWLSAWAVTLALVAIVALLRALAFGDWIGGYGGRHALGWEAAPRQLLSLGSLTLAGTNPALGNVAPTAGALLLLLLWLRGAIASPRLAVLAFASAAPWLNLLGPESARYASFSLPWLLGLGALGAARLPLPTGRFRTLCGATLALLSALLLCTERIGVARLFERADAAHLALQRASVALAEASSPAPVVLWVQPRFAFGDPRTRLAFAPAANVLHRHAQLVAARSVEVVTRPFEVPRRFASPPRFFGGAPLVLGVHDLVTAELQPLPAAFRFSLRPGGTGETLGVLSGRGGTRLAVRGWLFAGDAAVIEVRDGGRLVASAPARAAAPRRPPAPPRWRTLRGLVAATAPARRAEWVLRLPEGEGLRSVSLGLAADSGQRGRVVVTGIGLR